MRGVITSIEWLSEGIGGLAALIVIPLVLATCYEVFARYVFGAPTIWAFELGYILMGIHFLLGGAITLKRQGHIRIDLIYAQLSAARRAVIDLVLYTFLVLPALSLVFLRLADYAAEAYVSGETTGQSAWNPPIWPLRMIIAASFLLLTLQVVAEILKCIQTLRARDGDGTERETAA
jgi:TRAP-type mannitol/chloroaromatic compound transport system permease small subunit